MSWNLSTLLGNAEHTQQPSQRDMDAEYVKRISDETPANSNNVVPLKPFDPKRAAAEIKRLDSSNRHLDGQIAELDQEYQDRRSLLVEARDEIRADLNEKRKAWLRFTEELGCLEIDE